MNKKIYLSPHLDDAALSCGGQIRQQILKNNAAHVINFFAGVPDYSEEQFSPYAQKQHTKWQLAPKEAVAMRRLEDRNAAQVMGVNTENWEYFDAIYRKGNADFFYTDHQKLFGPIHTSESDLITELFRKLSQIARDYPGSIFYAPLRVGGHVDHLLVRECAIRLHQNGEQVVFYEDFPYVGRTEWRDEPTTVSKALAELPFRTESYIVEIDVATKIAANREYRSQLFSLFGDHEGVGMEQEIRNYTSRVGREEGFLEGYFERYWQAI